MTTALILKLGVFLVGFVLLFEVLRALVSGSTYGYYKSHVYVRRDDPGAFYFWLLLRAVIAVLMIGGAIALG
jgi:hypothetical protein